MEKEKFTMLYFDPKNYAEDDINTIIIEAEDSKEMYSEISKVLDCNKEDLFFELLNSPLHLVGAFSKSFNLFKGEYNSDDLSYLDSAGKYIFGPTLFCYLSFENDFGVTDMNDDLSLAINNFLSLLKDGIGDEIKEMINQKLEEERSEENE